MKTSHFISKALLLMTPLSVVGQLPKQADYYSDIEPDSGSTFFTNILRDEEVAKGEHSSGFTREFPGAQNIKWSTINNTQKVVFTLNGLTTKVFYDQQGKFSYSLTTYAAEQLPEEILRNVYQTYKKYKIISAKEVRSQEQASFHIILENDRSYKTIKVSNNHIEQIQRLQKSAEDQARE
jgi:hypothetical protein